MLIQKQEFGPEGEVIQTNNYLPGGTRCNGEGDNSSDISDIYSRYIRDIVVPEIRVDTLSEYMLIKTPKELVKIMEITKEEVEYFRSMIELAIKMRIFNVSYKELEEGLQKDIDDIPNPQAPGYPLELEDLDGGVEAAGNIMIQHQTMDSHGLSTETSNYLPDVDQSLDMDVHGIPKSNIIDYIYQKYVINMIIGEKVNIEEDRVDVILSTQTERLFISNMPKEQRAKLLELIQNQQSTKE